MTREEIIKLLAVLSDNYNVKIQNPAGKATAWEMVLGDYEADSIYKAARLHMSSNKYFPSPADLLKIRSRAELVYSTPPTNTKAIEAHTNKPVLTQRDHDFFDALCRKVGLGCDPDDSVYADLQDYLAGGTGLEKS